MFRTRLLSGIVLVVLATAVLLAGGPVFCCALLLLSLIAYRELCTACKVRGEGEKLCAPEILGYALILLYYGAVYAALLLDLGAAYVAMALTVAVAFLAFLFVYVFAFPRYHANQIQAAVFSYLYAPVMLSFLYLLREGFEEKGKYLVWFAVLGPWGSDTFAYCVGVLFGKHKMTPKLSPKKSIEGAVGGILGAVLLFVLYTHFVINSSTSFTFSLPLAGMLGAVGALVSMVGDLAASAIKRDHGIKDYGKLIPGHGGIMDRFDSVIATAPIVFVGIALLAAEW